MIRKLLGVRSVFPEKNARRQKRINWLLLLRLMQSYFLSIVQTPSLFAAGWSGQERSCSSSRKKHVYLAGYGLCLLCMRPCANEAMMENAIYASARTRVSLALLSLSSSKAKVWVAHKWKNQFLLLLLLLCFPADAFFLFWPISYLIKPPPVLKTRAETLAGLPYFETVILLRRWMRFWPILATLLPFAFPPLMIAIS